jgi:hypothetical protein
MHSDDKKNNRRKSGQPSRRDLFKIAALGALGYGVAEYLNDPQVDPNKRFIDKDYNINLGDPYKKRTPDERRAYYLELRTKFEDSVDQMFLRLDEVGSDIKREKFSGTLGQKLKNAIKVGSGVTIELRPRKPSPGRSDCEVTLNTEPHNKFSLSSVAYAFHVYAALSALQNQMSKEEVETPLTDDEIRKIKNLLPSREEIEAIKNLLPSKKEKAFPLPEAKVDRINTLLHAKPPRTADELPRTREDADKLLSRDKVDDLLVPLPGQRKQLPEFPTGKELLNFVISRINRFMTLSQPQRATAKTLLNELFGAASVYCDVNPHFSNTPAVDFSAIQQKMDEKEHQISFEHSYTVEDLPVALTIPYKIVVKDPKFIEQQMGGGAQGHSQ